MNKTPLISVIMPCHNASSYLESSIKSVIDQTFRDFELIIVDDASTDSSLSIAKNVSSLDNRVKVYKSDTNLGPGGARNFAIQRAQGEWLAILDSDDRFLQEKLQKQVKIIELSDDKLVLLGTGCFHINEKGDRLAEFRYPRKSVILKNRLFRLKAFPPHSTLIYRATAVQALGGFNEAFPRAQDFDLWLRLADVGDFSCIAEPLVEYRIHEGNITHSTAKEGYTQFQYAIAASVCRKLRKSGFVDPSLSSKEALWSDFMKHMAVQIRQSGEIEYREWKKQLFHSTPTGNGTKLRMFFLTIWRIGTNPHYMIKLFIEKAVGNPLPNKCFRSWRKEGK